MASYTDHYRFLRLTSTDFAADSWKFTDADRVLLDQLAYLGAEGHHHTGAAAALTAPTTGPSLIVSTTGGFIAGSARVRYIFSYISPDGIESGPSPETWIDTPAAIASPAVPTGFATQTTGGTLSPGPYFYAFSAYDGADSLETLAPNHGFIQVPLGTTTNVITMVVPDLPGAADGLNVYRKGPANTGYRYLASIVAPDPDDVFTDDGSGVEDPDRPLPRMNTTVAANQVEVTLPDTLPDGYLWRIYRTFSAGQWTSSLLDTTDELTYDDIGLATTTGEPTAEDVAPGSPAKIILTNGAEVTGLLPAAMVAGVAPLVNIFAQQGAPGGFPTLNDSGQLPVDHLAGAALVALAVAFR